MKPNYKTLQIQIPEGYEIDKSASTFENIVFKKKDSKPRSWKEYCEIQEKNKSCGYFININSTIQPIDWYGLKMDDTCAWKDVLPSKEYAEAFLALMQLVSLRKAWIGDWEPDWIENIHVAKYIIEQCSCKLTVNVTAVCNHVLSFPTRKMAEDFLECFKDLLEQAKILL